MMIRIYITKRKKREKNETKEKQMANSGQQAALDGACVCVFSRTACVVLDAGCHAMRG